MKMKGKLRKKRCGNKSWRKTGSLMSRIYDIGKLRINEKGYINSRSTKKTQLNGITSRNRKDI